MEVSLVYWQVLVQVVQQEIESATKLTRLLVYGIAPGVTMILKDLQGKIG